MNSDKNSYKAIFDSSTDVIVITDINGIVADINPAVVEIFGYNPEELIGKPENILIANDFVDEFNEFRDKTRKGEKTELYLLGCKKNGQKFHCQGRGMPLTFLSEPHMLTVIRDITRRKITEETIDKANQELKKVNKIRFSSNKVG